MENIKLTKNELKKQKDNLKRYRRYLPTLYIKKQQLQKEVAGIREEIEKLETYENSIKASVMEWSGVFCDDADPGRLVRVSEIIQEKDNIAGVDIPVLKSVRIDILPYDLSSTPLWIDSGIEALGLITETGIRKAFLNEQKRLIEEELRTTSQRVNLFEKIRIPESEKAIAKISVYLGDLQTIGTGWARIAKNRLS